VADPKVWLIGESNPYQADPARAQRYALYFEPPESAGGLLCRCVLGMNERDYLRAFERRNLCNGNWSIVRAREAVAALNLEMGAEDRVLLFGGKVWSAFFREVKYQPFTVSGRYLSLPHPSGRNAAVWGNYLSYSRVRAAVANHVPHLAPLLGRHELTRGRVAAEREVSHG
jgi:hypothetical protein